MQHGSAPATRRAFLAGAGAAFAAFATPAWAQSGSFSAFVERFRARARTRGVSEATYARVMARMEPDPEVLQLASRQAEFTEPTWRYLNQRVSEWRITTGRQRLQEHQRLLDQIEQRWGVDRHTVVSVWGNETAYGEIFTNGRALRSTLRSLATLAWGATRRNAYWEQELANALLIVERGWATPEQMVGSWAGAMGHTQFMPEAWLNVAVDFNGDGRRNLYEIPDALASTAHFLKTRGRWQTGEPWGLEVKAPAGFSEQLAGDGQRARSVAEWGRLGIARPDGRPLGHGAMEARLRFPGGVGGPGILMFRNFRAALAYNPSFNYALAVHHLADRLRGQGPFVTPWPNAERQLSTDELIEVQRRLTAAGLDTGGTDGRVGDMTRRAVRSFQERERLSPADGWPSERVLARLRASAPLPSASTIEQLLGR